MIRKIFIKIGSITIIVYKKLILKINKNIEENTEEKIENQTINEIIKQKNQTKKTIDKKIIIIPTVIISIYIISNNFQILFLSTAIIIFTVMTKKFVPKIKEDNRKKEISHIFPYALRQMSTQLKAGIGLYDSMKNIANSNYGALSDEFRITLNEIQYGLNYTEAFEKLSERTQLKSMEKLVNQIIRTLNNGGNLADTLNTLADENSYNMQIKYKEYSEKLNAIMLLYMFIAVLFPVILFILIIAATTVMGAIIKSELLLILYLFFFPMIIVFMIILIKRMEPSLS